VLPLSAGVLSAGLVFGTLVGQGDAKSADSDDDVAGMAAYMPGMSMPGMSMNGGSMDMGGGSDTAAAPGNGMDMNMPGMAGSGPTTVKLVPGSSKDAGGMTVRLVKISHGKATVQMGKDTAALSQGAHKKFGDGMTVEAVKVSKKEATLKVTPSP
jgi:hypothetical protein